MTSNEQSEHQTPPARDADEVRRLRTVLHGVRNPLAACRLELQLARRCEAGLAKAIDTGDLVSMRQELTALIESLEGIEDGVTEACSRLDNVERDLT